jgi:hypothetical protein
MTTLVVAEAVAIGLLGLLVAGLLRSHADILRRLHQLGAGDDDRRSPADVRFGLQPGVPAPRDGLKGQSPGGHDIAGQTPAGDAVALAVVGIAQNTLVAFLSSGCSTCADFWESFGGCGPTLPFGTQLVVVTKGTDHESESRLRQLAPSAVPVVMSSAVWAAYDVPVAPYFVLVDGPSGQVRGERAATSWAQVAHLWQQAAADGRLAERRTTGTGDDGFRAARADAELLTAGITPGHPSLYPSPLPEPPKQGFQSADRSDRDRQRALLAVAMPVAIAAGIRSTWSP